MNYKEYRKQKERKEIEREIKNPEYMPRIFIYKNGKIVGRR